MLHWICCLVCMYLLFCLNSWLKFHYFDVIAFCRLLHWWCSFSSYRIITKLIQDLNHYVFLFHWLSCFVYTRLHLCVNGRLKFEYFDVVSIWRCVYLWCNFSCYQLITKYMQDRNIYVVHFQWICCWVCTYMLLCVNESLKFEFFEVFSIWRWDYLWYNFSWYQHITN